MPTSRLFRLIVDDLTGQARFNLRLVDGQGKALAFHEVRADPANVCWRGLFEMDRYLELQRGRFSEEQQQSGEADRALLAELGDFLRTEVLGAQLAAHLFASQTPGLLFIELPAERRPEVFELTRISWELARDEKGRTLPDASLAVQVLPQNVMPPGVPLDVALAGARPFDPGGPLRVLLVFAQSHGQTAMAMRDMRERLNRFFLQEVATRYQIELDILQYGVTRDVLSRAARQGGGYHVVHLFAHGHENSLVLEDEQGRDDPVSGEEVAALLSGDFAAPPYLVFLTACHSGEVKTERGLTDLWRALRQAREPQDPSGLEDPKGLLGATYTGTAFAMLRAEVKQVVAMRYTVEERFSFDLAEAFYRYVLLDEMPPAQALGHFRVKAREEGDKRGYRPREWITPAFFGGAEGSQPIRLRRGRSPAADRLTVHGKLPDELRRVELFVGRTNELRDLRRHVFGESADKAVALLWGVGGLGKTALAAETVYLWHADFDFVLGAHPPAANQPLSLDGWLQDVNYHVMTSLGEKGYRIWDEQGETSRARWLESRLDELVRFLNAHRMLLVIDNLEPNLRREGEEDAVHYLCADPDWSKTLTRLARELTPGLSCLLLTSRRAPAELAERAEVLSLPVGPLEPGEWWVFARTAPNLRRLYLGSPRDFAVLARALSVARGHPLILQAMEKLAADPKELVRRLGEFETRGRRYASMGDLLAVGRTPHERAQEMAYFEDITAGSIRALIEDCSPATRRLLRMVTLALEPVYDRLIEAIWEDKGWRDDMPRLQPAGHGWREPLRELLDTGLLTPERKTMTTTAGESEEVVTYVWHPIVAEQAATVLPSGEAFPEAGYLRRYAYLHLIAYKQSRQQHTRVPAQVAIDVARDAVRYLLQLDDAKLTASFINEIHGLSQALDLRRDLQSWIHQLLEQVPLDLDREELLIALADIYREEGRPQAAIPLYQQVLESAQTRQAWRSCGVTSHNLGLALRDAADYPAARAACRDALRYMRHLGKFTAVRISGLSDLVRLMVIEGGERNLARARHHIVRLVHIARAYYERCQANPAAVEAQAIVEPVVLLVDVMDIQQRIERETENLPQALGICEEQIELDQQHRKDDLTIASHTFTRATNLTRMDRLEDAERDLLFCLRVQKEHQRPASVAKVLGELAAVAERQGDPLRAYQFVSQALDICYRLNNLSDVAISHNNLNSKLDKLGRTVASRIDWRREAGINGRPPI